MKVFMFFRLCLFFIYFLSSYALSLPYALCVQLIPGQAEITGDKGMYPRASGGLGRPDPLPYFKRLLLTVHVFVKTFCSILWTLDFQIQSCRLILLLRKNMITHSFTVIFFIFSTFINNQHEK